MSWIGALKKWNDRSPCWCVPRKGTKQHDDVKSIMNKKIEAVEAKAEVAMKIPMEPQRKSMSESNVPKATFHEHVPAPEKKTSAEIHQDNLRRTKEKEEKIKSADEELKQLMAEALEASKEGGKFKRRDNWKGKAGYMKKIDNLWKKYPAGIDRFRRAIPFDFGWSPS